MKMLAVATGRYAAKLPHRDYFYTACYDANPGGLINAYSSNPFVIPLGHGRYYSEQFLFGFADAKVTRFRAWAYGDSFSRGVTCVAQMGSRSVRTPRRGGLTSAHLRFIALAQTFLDTPGRFWHLAPEINGYDAGGKLIAAENTAPSFGRCH